MLSKNWSLPVVRYAWRSPENHEICIFGQRVLLWPKEKQQCPAPRINALYEEHYLFYNRGTSVRFLIWEAVLLPAASILTVLSLVPSGYRRTAVGPEAQHSSETSAEVMNEWSCASASPVCPIGMYRKVWRYRPPRPMDKFASVFRI
jgi:hypothetical protein